MCEKRVIFLCCVLWMLEWVSLYGTWDFCATPFQNQNQNFLLHGLTSPPEITSLCSLMIALWLRLKPYSDGTSFTWFYYRIFVILMADSHGTRNVHNFTRNRRSNFALPFILVTVCIHLHFLCYEILYFERCYFKVYMSDISMHRCSNSVVNYF